MAISRVWIEEGCISCGLCSDNCPDVFKMDDVAEVRENANFDDNEGCIIEAADSCPVEVIKYE